MIFRDFVKVGGLMRGGLDGGRVWRKLALYDRIVHETVKNKLCDLEAFNKEIRRALR